VRRAVVALTKVDLTPDEPGSVAAIRDRLRGSPFAGAAIVPTSVVSGRGLDELKVTLARVLAQTPPPRDIDKPRLPVDRVFTLPGIGTVVTGTLFGGTLRRGQSVVIQPSGKTARIRRIQSHGQDVGVSGPVPDGAQPGRSRALEDAARRCGDAGELGGQAKSSMCFSDRRECRSVKDGLRIRPPRQRQRGTHRAQAGELAVSARAWRNRLEAPAFCRRRSFHRAGQSNHTAGQSRGGRQSKGVPHSDMLAVADPPGVNQMWTALSLSTSAGAPSLAPVAVEVEFQCRDIDSAIARLVTAGTLIRSATSSGQPRETTAGKATEARCAHRPSAPRVALADLRTVLEGDLPAALDDILDDLSMLWSRVSAKAIRPRGVGSAPRGASPACRPLQAPAGAGSRWRQNPSIRRRARTSHRTRCRSEAAIPD
jgi:hypothetical protein